MKNTALLILCLLASNLLGQLPVTPAQETADNLILVTRSELLQRIALHKSLADGLWNNPASKPEEIIAAMGTRAGDFFKVYNENVRYLINLGHLAGRNPTASLRGEYLNLPRVKLNPDGTATMLPPEAPKPMSAAKPSSAKAAAKKAK